jgi:hypothetical protein
VAAICISLGYDTARARAPSLGYGCGIVVNGQAFRDEIREPKLR